MASPIVVWALPHQFSMGNKKVKEPFPQVNLVKAFSSIEVSASQMILACVKLT